MNWTPEEMDRLERAVVEGARVQITRRGSQFVVVPRRIRTSGSEEYLVAVTYTGDELSFALGEIERFEVIG